MYQPAMKTRLTDLEAEKAALLSRQKAPKPNPKVSVHPNLAGLYRRKVEELESLLDDATAREDAMTIIRSMIEGIVLTPRVDAGGLEAVLSGDLARILALCQAGSGGPQQQDTPDAVSVRGCQVSVVAGTRNHLELLLIWTSLPPMSRAPFWIR